jgi:hypothetical protein
VVTESLVFRVHQQVTMVFAAGLVAGPVSAAQPSPVDPAWRHKVNGPLLSFCCTHSLSTFVVHTPPPFALIYPINT